MIRSIDAFNKVFFHAHSSALAVLCLVVLAVAILAPVAWDAAVDHLQEGCDAGTIDAGTCMVAEIGGLVTPTMESQEVAP